MRFEQIAMHTALVKMNIDDLPLPHKENIQALLEFPIDGYTKLFRGKVIKESWEKTFKLVNQFITTLSVEEQLKISMFLITSHDKIIKFFSVEGINGLTGVTQDIGNKLDTLDKEINLLNKLEQFVDIHVPVGDFSKAGTRDQDTPALTFYEHEAKQLLSVVLMNKLLTPLFGTFIEYSKKQLGNQFKEVHCVTMLTAIFRRQRFELMTKLQNYIRHAINSKWKESPTSVYHSHTLDSLSEIITANIIVKDFVNIDLFYKNGNLITYIDVAAKHAILTNRNAEKNPVFPRLPIMASDGDDGNVAQLEIDSATSSKTFDTVIIIQSAIKQAVYDLLDLHEIDLNDYDTCVEYYKGTIIVPTIINQMIAVSYFSKAIGGGRGIMFLTAPEYLQVVVATQVVMFKLGYHELAHMITSNQGSVKMIPSDTDNVIKITATSSDEFRNCCKKYEKSPVGADVNAWTNKINKVVQEIADTTHIYNTADLLWERWDTENLNGKTINYSKDLISALCSFVELA